MTSLGRSLELFFVEGQPDGMLTAEVFNWTGHVLKTPRTQISAALSRSEARHTGVYLLLGDRDGKPVAYIGESEDVSERIRNHDVRKEWWTDAVLMTTTSDALNKAHVKYLESRLVEIARAVGSTPLENGNTPARASLSEASRANMEEFLETLFIVLPALGITLFLNKSRAPEDGKAKSADPRRPRFQLETAKHGVRATAFLDGSDFVVQEESAVRNGWYGKGGESSYSKLYQHLVATGVIQKGAIHAVTTTDYAFNSPSAAAAVVNGRSSNGRLEWKHIPDGRSYAEWEADQLEVPRGYE